MTQKPPMMPGPVSTFAGRGGMEPHRGGTILALGIISLVVNLVLGCGGLITGGFSCFGVPVALALAIPAWLMANNDLRRISAGTMDPAGRSNTSTGRVCAIVSVAMVIVSVVLALLAVLGALAMFGVAAGAAGGAGGAGGPFPTP